MAGRKKAARTEAPATESAEAPNDFAFRPLEAASGTKLSDAERAKQTQFVPLLTARDRKAKRDV